MTVYIDHYPEWLGVPRKWTGGGHLFGTDLAELHLFANSIGLKREWFQGEQFPHYDLTARKRSMAIKNGAIETEPGVIPSGVIRSMKTKSRLPARLIDLDALDRVRNGHLKWRSRHGQKLGSRYVGGEGNDPVAMLIGEAPGAQEDANLRPFVGDSGLVLRELMALAGLFTGETPHFGDANCWLTNVVKFRPPGNKTPTDQQVVSVRKLLRAEWAAVGCPPIIVTIGGVALHAVEGQKRSVLKLCGAPLYRKSATGGNLDMYVWPMIHPSFGLRGGKQVQEKLETHWIKLGEFLKGHTA